MQMVGIASCAPNPCLGLDLEVPGRRLFVESISTELNAELGWPWSMLTTVLKRRGSQTDARSAHGQRKVHLRMKAENRHLQARQRCLTAMNPANVSAWTSKEKLHLRCLRNPAFGILLWWYFVMVAFFFFTFPTL